MINPLSTEQAEGPKKVIAVLSGLATALVIKPHNEDVPILKLHLTEEEVSVMSHPLQVGRIIPGVVEESCLAEVSGCDETGGVVPPSRLYSLAQFVKLVRIRIKQTIHIAL